MFCDNCLRPIHSVGMSMVCSTRHRHCPTSQNDEVSQSEKALQLRESVMRSCFPPFPPAYRQNRTLHTNLIGFFQRLHTCGSPLVHIEKLGRLGKHRFPRQTQAVPSGALARKGSPTFSIHALCSHLVAHDNLSHQEGSDGTSEKHTQTACARVLNRHSQVPCMPAPAF